MMTPASAHIESATVHSFEDDLPTFGEIWAGIMSHLWIVVICFCAGLAAGLYLFSAPKRYTSTATIRIQPSNGSGLAVSASQVLEGGSPSDEKINSELTIMQGRTILLKVAEDLNLANSADFWGTKTSPHLNMSDPLSRDKMMRRLQAILVFVRQPKSDIVQISCTSSSPLLSAQIPNTITNEYIARIFQVRYGSTERVSRWLGSQLNDLRDQVERDQEQLVGLQDRLGVLGLNQGGNAYLLADSLQGITHAQNEATVQRIVAEAKLRVLSESDPNLIESEQPPLQGVGQQPLSLLQNLRASQAEASASYATLAARLGPNYPDVLQAKARLDEINRAVKTEQQRILNQAKTSFAAAASNEKMTSGVLNSLKDKAFASHGDMVRFVVLQRQYEADRVLYESLMQRLRVAGINAGLESAQVDTVDLADISSTPKNPLPYQWLILLIFAGLALGLAFATAADRLDTRLRKPGETEKLIGIPLLANLHRFPMNSQSAFSFVELKSGAYAEGQQFLRNSVLLSQPDRPPNSILVTSSIAGEGKSTVSRGLAAMLAMHGAQVLLVDADLHRAAQSRLFGSKPLRGLSEILTSNIDADEVILPIPDVHGLYLLPAGRTPPQPATLLSSEKMQLTMDTLKSKFDFVIVDSPPVLLVSDSVLCASLVDVVVVVVRENMAERKAVRETIALLRKARGTIIGFAMNATTNRGSGYGSYYSDYGNYSSSTESGE